MLSKVVRWQFTRVITTSYNIPSGGVMKLDSWKLDYALTHKANKKLNKDKKQLAFCSLRSLILANYFLPVN